MWWPTAFLGLCLLFHHCGQAVGISCYLCDINKAPSDGGVPPASQSNKDCASTDPKVLQKFAYNCNDMPAMQLDIIPPKSNFSWCQIAVRYDDNKKGVLQLFRSCVAPLSLGMNATRKCVTRPLDGKDVQYCGCDGDLCNNYVIDKTGSVSNTAVDVGTDGSQDVSTEATSTPASGSGDMTSTAANSCWLTLTFTGSATFLIMNAAGVLLTHR